MLWLDLSAWCFGGFLLANAVPHAVSGMMGRPFQTPFASPPGRGLSSAPVNVVWGFANIVAGAALVCHVGHFTFTNIEDSAVFLLGAFVSALFMARHFGRLHGGDRPDRP
ncbi:hypothetical protein [Acetobacter orleanensis]|uniref:Uncharacterized protein n=1 Tax=Acetobacter orleanensis TaxID=104099 RepID=A0A4Y3TPG0_9PROT|nr:hypothetical protein [Acetobacter orleanensis]KXV67029.1 hypothetical protein AD949_00750 [Acetobacter orleanensis]PCD78716.1 hypothetical protein CO710_11000 [Acetobacter orleanensis]GAN67366.1 hypothetical protein Abol_002_032 [Acetobacter orleanensis JCM 7639]GBR23640.1 hypothetical protein AA0473_0428 [Acetobacter orleanensis NRIC 0473]GEB83349.1 hypothetical protein AOR01nite_18260 [Acetobacter orleanensis]